MKLIPNFLRRAAPPETGEENAQRFVATVSRLAREDRFITCYPHEPFRGQRLDRFNWIWMLNAAWRARVLELLAAAPVMNAAFLPPDSLDGWTFQANSTVPVPRIAQLSLEDTL